MRREGGRGGYLMGLLIPATEEGEGREGHSLL